MKSSPAEFKARGRPMHFIFIHQALHRLDPHRVVLSTRMQWQCLSGPKHPHGKPIIPSTPAYKVFAQWADEGALWQACIASGQPLATAPHLDTRVLHGDGSNTEVKKGAMAWAPRAANPGTAAPLCYTAVALWHEADGLHVD
jgi:hypothetical protein